jgi:peroxiredoxin
MPALTQGELIPDFRLPAARGGSLGPWDFKQRRNLVILFHHGLGCDPCRALLRELRRRYPAISAQQAEVLAVSPDPPEELAKVAETEDIPFPLLSDRGARVLDNYRPEGGPSLPAVFVTDRYGALAQAFSGEGHRLDLDGVIEELAFIQCRCPECHLEPDE